MGSELCKNVKNNEQNELKKQSRIINCQNCCYPASNKLTLKIDEKILPIQFSDLGSDKNTPKKWKQKSQVVSFNNELNSNLQASPNGANQQNSTNQNIKQNLQLALKSPRNAVSSNKEIQLVKSQRIGINSVQLNVYQPINVPYSVIKLIIKPQILKQMKKIDRDFQKIHGDPKSETFRTWKLHSKGFYTNIVSDGSTIIITQQQFYQGKVKLNSFKAEESGLLINQSGSYRGAFKDGLAHGKGVYVSANGKRRFQGQWKAGQLEKGKIQTEFYKYEGELKNNVPNGHGSLQILNKKVTYSGPFLNGLFDGKNGEYACDQYVYKGDFKLGKKNGQGTLIQKQRSATKQLPNIKLKNIRTFVGLFENDIFTEVKETSKLK